MSLLHLPAAILAISALVVIHEFGHYIVARAFGMRVMTFSIGFGPPLVRYRPKGSDTVFQIALIPVLAYVQIAGMNPRETSDPNDRGSYQNARPIARFLAIAAGPLANLLAASLLMFFVGTFGGLDAAMDNGQVGSVQPGSAAAAAGLQADDTIVAINEVPIRHWNALVAQTSTSHGQPIRVELDRHGQRIHAVVTPRMSSQTHRYMIGVANKTVRVPGSLATGVELAVVGPARGVVEVVRALGGMIIGRVPFQPEGLTRIVEETQQQMRVGWRETLDSIASISLQLAIFNLLPIPALDGGRLGVLGYEMATKRRPNPRVEARVLAVSMTVLLSFFLFVNLREIWQKVAGLFHG